MEASRVVPAVVTGMGGLMAGAFGLMFFLTPDAPYADLVPNPQDAAFAEDADTRLWLYTNLDSVDLAIDSDALGVNTVATFEDGQVVELGPGPGCPAVDETSSVRLLPGAVVDLEGCAEESDVVITLQDADAEELNRYTVDVGPVATATPAPATPVPGPVFDPEYRNLTFCADTASARALYLTGGETVGTVTATGSGTLAYALEPDGDSLDYAFFDVDSATGAITASDAGAGDHAGMDGTRLYTFDLVATDANGLQGRAVVAVQLDLTNLATNDDGVCP